MTSGSEQTRHRPLVVAHRGSSDEVAEHTLAAYRQAVADGADAIECDVRLTRDGHLVCLHDRRLERTSSGRGVVSTKRLEELYGLDWTSWKNPWADLDDEADLPDPAAGSLVTVRELFTMVRDLPAPVELAVETKHPTRYSGLVERRLCALLEEFGWNRWVDGHPPPVRVMSFSILSLRRMRRLAPAVPLAWLVSGELPLRLRRGELPPGVDIVAPSVDLVRRNPAWVALMHNRGRRVHTWVVNTADDVRMCQWLGVEAIITDRPRFAGQVLDQRPAGSP